VGRGGFRFGWKGTESDDKDTRIGNMGVVFVIGFIFTEI